MVADTAMWYDLTWLIKGTVTWDVQNPFLPFVYSQEINAINVSLVRRQSTIKNKTTETEQMKCQQWILSAMANDKMSSNDIRSQVGIS